MSKNPSLLIRAILDQKDDIFYALLRRAGKCGAEIWSELHPRLQARIRNGIWRVWVEWSKEEEIRNLEPKLLGVLCRVPERSDAWHERLQKDFSLRDGAFYCLTQVDQLTRRRLIDVLRNTNGNEAMLASKSYARRAAAKMLGLIRAREAIPTLISQLRNIDVDVEAAVAQALGEMQATEAIPALVKCLDDSSSYWRLYRWSAALAILKISEWDPTQMRKLFGPCLAGDADLRDIVAGAVFANENGITSPDNDGYH